MFITFLRRTQEPYLFPEVEKRGESRKESEIQPSIKKSWQKFGMYKNILITVFQAKIVFASFETKKVVKNSVYNFF